MLDTDTRAHQWIGVRMWSIIWCTYGFHVYRASNGANNIATNFGLLKRVFNRNPWGSRFFLEDLVVMTP